MGWLEIDIQPTTSYSISSTDATSNYSIKILGTFSYENFINDTWDDLVAKNWEDEK
tara:strand:- start:2859 stop:3026 length:168 start_codon:yes stop_codon:yes gene_type:complete